MPLNLTPERLTQPFRHTAVNEKMLGRDLCWSWRYESSALFAGCPRSRAANRRRTTETARILCQAKQEGMAHSYYGRLRTSWA